MLRELFQYEFSSMYAALMYGTSSSTASLNRYALQSGRQAGGGNQERAAAIGARRARRAPRSIPGAYMRAGACSSSTSKLFREGLRGYE